MINGDEIFISTGGRDFDPKGKVLLFIHGSGQSIVFALQNRYFANRFRFIAIHARSLPEPR